LIEADLRRILLDKNLAQFGDSLLNFAYSLALTEITGKPTGFKIQDKVLAEASVKSGLRKHLPRRVNRGDVANGFEALVAYAWIEKRINLDEIVSLLKKDRLSHIENFTELADTIMSRIVH
jgi:hypothetical protein